MPTANDRHLMLLADGTSPSGSAPLPADVRSGKAPMVLCAAVGRLMAASDGDGAKLRRFEMEAYNGGAMRFYWADDPVVVDISGLTGTDRSRPILKDHNQALIVGHTEKIEAKKTIRLTGVISGAGQVAREVVESADNGFPWQASIGVDVERIEYIESGATVTVNGREFIGPLLIVRAGTFKECSFVALGADDSTTAAMLAAARNNQASPTGQKGTPMNPEFIKWLKAQGWSQDKIDAIEVDGVEHKTLMAAWKASEPGNHTDTPDALTAQREQMAAESERVAGIRAACAGQHAKIEAQAIRDGWSVEKAELHVLRASRPQAPGIIIGGAGGPSDSMVLRAAAMQTLGLKLDGMDDHTLQAAHDRYHGRLGLGQLIMEAAWARGFTGRSLRADMAGALRAAWSDLDMSGIFSSIANKTLLDAFNSVEDTWRRVGAITSLRDFKAATRYRMTAAGTYAEVGPGGEIKHGAFGEESFTNQAKTYALMYAITRQDIINDDLGALQATPKALGLGAARKLNLVFWAAFLNNSTFFTTGNGNYAEGASTALDVDSLTAAELLFLNQTDANGDPLAVTPGILLVPNALNVAASTLMRSTELRDTTASKKYATSNPHAGKLTVERSSYLSNANLTGYSTTAWYMLANPNELPVIEVAFLDGQQAPTIEQADADFNTLGIQMRGYHDFGVSLQDHRAGVKMKGAV